MPATTLPGALRTRRSSSPSTKRWSTARFASPTASCSKLPRRSPARSSRRGFSPEIAWPSGRRTVRAGSSLRSACTPRARCSCRSTLGTRATRPVTSCARPARACSSRSPTSSAPAFPSSSTACPDSTRSSEIVVLDGPPHADCTTFDAFLARGASVPQTRDRRPRRRDLRRRRVRHHLHVGHHRLPEGCGARPRRQHPHLPVVERARRPPRTRPLPRRVSPRSTPRA